MARRNKAVPKLRVGKVVHHRRDNDDYDDDSSSTDAGMSSDDSDFSERRGSARRGRGAARRAGRRQRDSSSDSGRGSSDSEHDLDSDDSDRRNSSKRRQRAKEDPTTVLGDQIRRAVREGAGSDPKGVMQFIKSRFNSADSDRNGHVDQAEFRLLISSVLGGRSVSNEEVAGVMRQIDNDGNGRITYDEFVSFVSMDLAAIKSAALALHKGLQPKTEAEGVGKVFKSFATATSNRKSATIGTAQLRKMAAKVSGDVEGVKKMTSGEMGALLAQIDTEGLGAIDLANFTSFMSNYAADVERAEERERRERKRRRHGGVDKAERSTSSARDARPIVELRLSLSAREERRFRAEKYQRLPANLNERGGWFSKPVRLWYKKAGPKDFLNNDAFTRARVTDIKLWPKAKDAGLTAAGYEVVKSSRSVGASTNAGAWFAPRRYLWVRRNVEDEFPIMNVAVTTGNRRDRASKLWTPPYRGFKLIDGDLNQGNSRKSQVFLWYWKTDFGFENEHAREEALDRADPLRPLSRLIRRKMREAGETGDESIDLDQIWARYDDRQRGFLRKADLVRVLKGLKLEVKTKDLRKIADLLDANKNDKIEKDELIEFLGYNPAELDAVAERVRQALRRTSGNLPSNDMRAARREVKRAFKQYADRSGLITARGLGRTLKRLGVPLTHTELTGMMGRFDRDGDGQIDLDEFARFVLTAPNSADASFARVEQAARKLRSWARKRSLVAGSGGDNNAAVEYEWSKAFEALRAVVVPRGKTKKPMATSFKRKNKKTGKEELLPVATADQVRVLLENETGLALVPTEAVTLLRRVGSKDGEGVTLHEFASFASSKSYIDSILNVVVDLALDSANDRGVNPSDVFKRFDENGDGQISAEEFGKGLSDLQLDGVEINLTKKELQELVQRFDRDGDGAVDVDEFLRFIKEAESSRRLALEHSAGDGLDPAVLTVLSALRREARRMADHDEEDLHKRYRKAFEIFDIERRGMFTKHAFEKGLTELDLIVPKDREGRSLSPSSRNRKRGARRHRGRQKSVYLSDANVEQAFGRLDTNRTGNVDLQSFVAFVEEDSYDDIDWSDDEMADYDSFSDTGSGRRAGKHGHKRSVDKLLNEAAKVLRREFGGDDDEALEARFKRFDEDNSGALSVAEFSKVLRDLPGGLGRRMSREEMKRLAKALDVDSSNYIDYREFCDFIRDEAELELRRESDENEYSDYDSTGGSDSGGGASTSKGNRTIRRVQRAINTAVKARKRKGMSRLDRSTLRRELRKASRANNRDYISLFDALSVLEKLKVNGLTLSDLEAFVRVAGCNVSLTGRKKDTRKGKRSAENEVDIDDFSQSTFDKSLCRKDSKGGYLSRAGTEAVKERVRRAIEQSAARGIEYEKTFTMFDHDGSGTITKRDLRRVTTSLGCELTHAELDALLANVDKDGDGKIDYDEFLAFVKPAPSNGGAQASAVERRVRIALREHASKHHGVKRGKLDLKRPFAKFDRNGDGVITRRDFRRVLKDIGVELSNEEIDTLIARFDVDGDGKMSYKEFAELFEMDESSITEIASRLRHNVRQQSRRGVSTTSVFRSMDTNGDGVLSRREFRTALNKLGLKLSDKEIQRVVEHLDPDGNGKVDYNEFAAFIKPTSIELSALEAKLKQRIRETAVARGGAVDIRRAFQMFDTLGSGQITRREFQQGCERFGLDLSQEELELLLERFDINGDNEVDYFEFARFVAYDGAEMAAVTAKAAKHMDSLRRSGTDPLQAFANYETKPIKTGFVTRREFHNACRDLNLPLSDTEVAAFCDLYAQFSGGDRVQYGDFVNATLRAGDGMGKPVLHPYEFAASTSEIPEPLRRSDHQDGVWNADAVSAFLADGASPRQRKKFQRLPVHNHNLNCIVPCQHLLKSTRMRSENLRQKSCQHLTEKGRAPLHVKSGSSASLDRGLGTLMTSIQCAKRRTTKRESGTAPCAFTSRLTSKSYPNMGLSFQRHRFLKKCAMCESPNPFTVEGAESGQPDRVVWPHIQPLIDEATIISKPFRRSGTGIASVSSSVREDALHSSMASALPSRGWRVDDSVSASHKGWADDAGWATSPRSPVRAARSSVRSSRASTPTRAPLRSSLRTSRGSYTSTGEVRTPSRNSVRFY